jgi:hypothetical protein
MKIEILKVTPNCVWYVETFTHCSRRETWPVGLAHTEVTHRGQD